VPPRAASFLVEVSRPEIPFGRDPGAEPPVGESDSWLPAHAFGNVIKNAAESIEAVERDGGERGVIRVTAEVSDGMIEVNVVDNGKGLPRENRQRLLEPYMTTREKGTGLGLAIVKKIVEDHGGRLELHDAPADFHGVAVDHRGVRGRGEAQRHARLGTGRVGTPACGEGRGAGDEEHDDGGAHRRPQAYGAARAPRLAIKVASRRPTTRACPDASSPS